MKPLRRDCCIWLWWIVTLMSVMAPAQDKSSAVKAASAQSGLPKIGVGPNILVSRDGNTPHVELIAASNPTDPKNVLGAAITFTSFKGNMACKTYASTDGGITWIDTTLPEQHQFGGGDPQVAFGTHGTAYFSALTFAPNERGETQGALLFYRSTDGGTTWEKPVALGSRKISYDHDIMAVDQTLGKYSGRVYVSALYGYPVYKLGLFRSDDDGRTFTGPVEAASGGGKVGINTISNMLVLRDGSLIMPYVDFAFEPEKAKKDQTTNLWITRSTDGGITFSAPHKVLTEEHEINSSTLRYFSVEAAAVDTSDAFPDRIYLVWSRQDHGKYRIMMSYSSDRGDTWSEAKLVDKDAPEGVIQYQSSVAVNKDGTLGITWFDTRNSKDGSQYDEYFTASVDGGASFLPLIRMSSAISTPDGPGNRVILPDAFKYPGKLVIGLLSAFSRWGGGGDYMGLAADMDGAFHPFWSDSRTGTFQIQSTRLTVENPNKKTELSLREKMETAAAKKRNEQEAGRPRVESDLIDRVELVFDPTTYDAATKVIEVPIHVKNISSEPIYGPVRLELEGFGFGDETDDKEANKKNAPLILTAANGKQGEGAVFDYTRMLGSEQMLAPGALSGAIPWRMKLVNTIEIPMLRVKATGSIGRQ